MRKVIDKRQSGKTTKLLFTSSVMGFPVLTTTVKRKQVLEDMARRAGLEVNIFSLMDIDNGGLKESQFFNKVMVDDADEVLKALIFNMTGKQVEVISLSSESE